MRNVFGVGVLTRVDFIRKKELTSLLLEPKSIVKVSGLAWSKSSSASLTAEGEKMAVSMLPLKELNKDQFLLLFWFAFCQFDLL